MRLRPVAYDWLFGEKAQYDYHKIHDAYLYENDRPLFGGGGVQGALYLVRNPLDVAVSYAHHCGVDIDKAIGFMGDPEHCMANQQRRLHEQLMQPLLTWSQHVESWVDAKDIGVQVQRYEDMHDDAINTFTRAALFLRLPHDEARIDKAMRMARFDELKQQEQQAGFRERSNRAENFFRKGIVGDWRERLSCQQVDRIVRDHFDVMRRFDYVDGDGVPICPHPRPLSRRERGEFR